MDLVLMTQDFQAKAGMTVQDVVELFIPNQVGVGIIQGETAQCPALLGLHLKGRHEDKDEDTTLMIALDTERTVGLIVQLKGMLLGAGVDGGVIIKMMREADARFEAIRDMDRAPREDPPSFTCPKCGMTSYHPTDIKEGYCGNCHDWTGTST